MSPGSDGVVTAVVRLAHIRAATAAAVGSVVADGTRAGTEATAHREAPEALSEMTEAELDSWAEAFVEAMRQDASSGGHEVVTEDTDSAGQDSTTGS